MNILYTITFLHFGAGRALVDLAIEARRRGHQAVIAATKKIDRFESQPHLIEDAEKAGVPVFLYDDLFTRDFHRVSLSADQLMKIFRERKFDLIHSHAAIPAFAAALGSRKVYSRLLPQVLTMHSWSPDKSDWMKLQDVMILNNMDVVQAVSADLVDFLAVEGVKRERIRMIYNGYDFERIDRLITKQETSLLPRNKKFRIGLVSDLSERKGIKYLIDAVANLPLEILEQIEVVIAGDGSEKEALIGKVDKLGLNRIFSFVGYVSNPFQYIKSFDLFILPSLSEGLPVSLVEAMYLKVPVLATNVQGSKEIIQSGVNGTLVPPKDSQALAAEIVNFCQNPLKYQGKLAAAYTWVTANFNRQAAFDKIFDLYGRLEQK